jgi:uncharacterized protein (TIGR01777 family)
MRVLVTGSHGLIGTALVEALSARGDDVTPLSRPAGWDPDAGTIDRDLIAGHDAVVHLAGESLGERRWTDEQKRRIMDSRRAGTSLLTGALAGLPGDVRPSVLVSASAIGYYGDRGDETLTESSSAGHGFLADVVREWEAAAAPARDAAIRVVHPRTGVVMSPRGGALARQLLPFRLGLGGPLGGGTQWLSWVSLDDEVAALLHCIDTPSLSGPVNVVAPTPVTQREFASTLGRVLHRPAVLPTPLLPLRLVYGRELVAQVLLWSQRVVPDALVASGFAFRHPTLEEALRAVGL